MIAKVRTREVLPAAAMGAAIGGATTVRAAGDLAWRRVRRTWARLAAALAVVGLFVTWSARADAYPWMIRHGYAGCTTCHADPSGGGLLTEYGRAQGELLLRTRYGSETGAQEAGSQAEFLFGAISLPESVLLGGDFRAAELDVMVPGTPATTEFIWMQADVEGQWTIADRVHLNASLGYVPQGDQPAALTPWPSDNVISRVHWVGVDLDSDKTWMVRAGRINLPFGLRDIEHTYWVRTATQTDIDDTQEDGVSVAYNGPNGIRGEAMAIAGNYQLHPDMYRQRGYSAYVEWAPAERLAVGVSSLATHAAEDVTAQAPAWRQAHGLFGRWSPVQPLVLSTEWDMTVLSQAATTSEAAKTTVGMAGMLNADVEVIQGVHVGATGEFLDSAFAGPTAAPPSLGFWTTAWWFFAPRLDFRGDFIVQSISAESGRSTVKTLLFQLHAYL